MFTLSLSCTGIYLIEVHTQICGYIFLSISLYSIIRLWFRGCSNRTAFLVVISLSLLYSAESLRILAIALLCLLFKSAPWRSNRLRKLLKSIKLVQRDDDTKSSKAVLQLLSELNEMKDKVGPGSSTARWNWNSSALVTTQIVRNSPTTTITRLPDL